MKVNMENAVSKNIIILVIFFDLIFITFISKKAFLFDIFMPICVACFSIFMQISFIVKTAE